MIAHDLVKAEIYARRIRNDVKRRYAKAIISAQRAGESWPAYPREISFMAAQAVHQSMEEIFGIFANLA